MDKGCSVDACDLPVAKKGMCNKHYIRLRRHGDPNVCRKAFAPEDGLCTVEGCELPWLSRGYCKGHYERFMKYGDPLGSAPKVTACLVNGCDNAHKGRGYCVKHLRRLKLYGDPTFTPPSTRRLCDIDECDDEHYAMDLCRSHYWIKNQHGDPLAVPRREPKVHAREYPERPCATCGDLFSPGNSLRRLYCRKACRPSYRPRQSGLSSTRTTALKVAAAHGHYCHLCRGDIDMRLYYPHAEAPTIDHITPASIGGKDVMSNYALAHFRCNIRRGNRVIVATESLGSRTFRTYAP